MANETIARFSAETKRWKVLVDNNAICTAFYDDDGEGTFRPKLSDNEARGLAKALSIAQQVVQANKRGF